MNATAEQLVLLPRRVFREIELGAPASIRRLCRAPAPAARRATTPKPTRWIPGTAPTVHLPMTGSGRTRNNRAGRKPASIGTGKLSRHERSAFRLLEWELLHEGVKFGPPATLGDCQPGPCGHVGCRWNLYLDVVPSRHKACPGVGATLTASTLSPGTARCAECTGLFPHASVGDEAPPHKPAPVIKLNFPGKEIDEIPDTCALRVANRVAQRAVDAAIAAMEDGGDEPGVISEKRELMTLEEVGRLLNLTMGRADQIEKKAVKKCATVATAEGWGEAWRGILARS